MIRSFVYDPSKLKEVLTLEVCEREAKELRAQGINDPKEALKKSLESSITSWYFMDDDRVCGVGGVAPHPQNKGMGIVWLLVDEVMLRKYLFTCNSLAHDALDYCFNELGMYCVCNYVSVENKLSVKWLKSLGFEFMEHYAVFADTNVVFDEFYMYKEDYLGCVM